MNQDREEGTKGGQSRLISLIVPVYNEEEAVPAFVEAVAPELTRVRSILGNGVRTEIIFDDDGSTDNTLEVLRGLDVPGTIIRLVRLSRNFGKDAALTAGLLYAKGDAAIPMDDELTRST